jgi:flavin reductase (DIM6/NTAB) family NADH-FMN oxidoreductase RutF
MSVKGKPLESERWSGPALFATAAGPKVYATVDAKAFRRGMRQLSAAVTVVTTGADTSRRAGLTATAICSVSAEPPQLLVCVNRRGEAHARIREWRNFCVNVLCHGQVDIARRFAGMEGAQVDRFTDGEWSTLATGAPVLAGCIANFDCELRQEVEAGTHSVFIGEVVALSVNRGRHPLAYVDGQFLPIQTVLRQVNATTWDWS